MTDATQIKVLEARLAEKQNIIDELRAETRSLKADIRYLVRRTLIDRILNSQHYPSIIPLTEQLRKLRENNKEIRTSVSTMLHTQIIDNYNRGIYRPELSLEDVIRIIEKECNETT